MLIKIRHAHIVCTAKLNYANKNKVQISETYNDIIGGRTNMTYFYNLGTQLVNSRILFKFTHSYILKLIVYLIEAVLQLERFFAVEIFSAENDLPLDTLCGFLHPGFSPERATQRDFS